MTVYFIGAGPGDPELLTLRAHRLLQRCPVCLYAGSLVPAEVIACAPPGGTVVNTADLHLDQIIAHMATAHARGQDVARVHSGDPSLYGAIAEQMRRLDELGIPYEVVPGVSSFTAAAAALKIELTPAGGNQTVILEFESVEAAKAWYNSPEYQEAIPLRQKAADCNAVIVKGFGA